MSPPRPRAASSLSFALLLSFVIAGPACHRATPAAPPASPSMGNLQVLKNGRYLFTYVEPSGSFSTTDKPEIIPEASRKMVRVVDPARTQNADTADVYAVDVNELLKNQKTDAHPLPREAFETSAIAQLPPGDSSLRSGHAGAGPSGAGGAPAFPSAPGKPVVTVYGTSWCGACRAARQYFSERKIPFADKDIEADPAAAHELAEKAAKMGIPTDRVPVLDVRGRLLLGFDRARVEALLGNPT
jgi:glutaredoxin